MKREREGWGERELGRNGGRGREGAWERETYKCKGREREKMMHDA